MFVICAAVLSACDKWPPHGDDLTEYFSNRKPHIEELVSRFRDSEFRRIECQLCFAEDAVTDWTTRSYIFSDEKWRVVENPRSDEFASMFDSAGVSAIGERSSGTTELEIAVRSDYGDRMYAIQLFHDPGHVSNTFKECIAEFKDISCGACKVSIDESLWIRYQWYPRDIDPELSELGANGEISWDEWQERSNALQDACFEEGLLEQGYERDDE